MSGTSIRVCAAAGAIACLLLAIAYFSPSGRLEDWPKRGANRDTAKATFEDKPIEADSSVTDLVERKNAAATSGDQSRRWSIDLDPAALAIEAQSNPDAADDLAYLIGLCAHFEYVPAGDTEHRLAQPAWAKIAATCTKRSAEDLTSSLATAAAFDSKERDAFNEALEKAPTLENLQEKDRVLAEIIDNSSDIELVAHAAKSYFDRERMLAWANSEIPASLLADGDVSLISTSVAQSLACQIGRDCSPYALATLHECAGTAGCVPGMSLQQVINMRHSPQDQALINDFVRTLVRRRQGGG